MHIVEIGSLTASYGAGEVLHSLELTVSTSEIACVIGANGAGKTTLMRAIMGAVRCSGSLLLEGDRIDHLPTFERARRGMSLLPTGRGTLNGLTVAENLRIAARKLGKRNATKEIERWLTLFPRLSERLKSDASALSGGEQQMLALVRAMLLRPKVLLLDEPSMGLAPNLCDLLFAELRRINENEGTAMLVAEQDISRVLGVAHKGYVLRSGSIIREAQAEELLSDPDIRAAYLGV